MGFCAAKETNIGRNTRLQAKSKPIEFIDIFYTAHIAASKVISKQIDSTSKPS